MRGLCPLFFERFLLTRLLRGATTIAPEPADEHLISTHTPLARRDKMLTAKCNYDKHFYSHASCEARPGRRTRDDRRGQFLLTRLLRGATSYCTSHPAAGEFLLTRLLRGATMLFARIRTGSAISTHTPLARRDTVEVFENKSDANFYSHASCEARQLHIVYVTLAPPIYKRRTQNYNKIFYKIQYFA